MQIVRNQDELEDFCFLHDGAYDVEDHWELSDCFGEKGYTFPAMLECCGYTSLGEAFRVHTKESIEEQTKTLEEFKSLFEAEKQ